MSDFKFYTFLFIMIGSGFFCGYQIGQIATVVGAWPRAALSAIAVAVICLSMVGSAILGIFTFAHDWLSARPCRYEGNRGLFTRNRQPPAVCAQDGERGAGGFGGLRYGN